MSRDGWIKGAVGAVAAVALCCGVAALLIGAGVLAVGGGLLGSPELTVGAVALGLFALGRLARVLWQRRSS
jgi:hypothetical protein